MKILKLIFLLILTTTTVFGGSMEFKDKIELTSDEWEILLEDIKREPTFIGMEYKNFTVEKEYIQFYDEIIVEDEMYKYQYKKVINGEKILIPQNVQKNKIVWRHDYGHNFYTYEFDIREDGMHLNGFVYKNGKWAKTISSITQSRKFRDQISAVATVSALLVGVIVAPVLLIVDLLKSPFKSKINK